MLSHDASVRTEFALALTSHFARGGTLELQTIGGARVAALKLAAPAFGPVLDGSCALNDPTPDSNARGGQVAIAVFRDPDGIIRLSALVTPIGGQGDIEIDEVDVKPGRTVRVRSIFYNAPR